MDPDSFKYWVVANDLSPVLTAVTYIQPQTSDQSSHEGHFIRAGLDSQCSTTGAPVQLVKGLLSVSM